MTAYVRLIRREPVTVAEGPRSLPKAWRNLSGFDKLGSDEQRRHGWYPFKKTEEPAYNPRTHKLIRRLAIEDGVVVSSTESVELTAAERTHLLAEARREILAELPAIRFSYETGGIVFDGIPLRTDRESRAELALAAQEGVGERWKAADGKWYDLDAERLQSASQAVKAHKRACFANEEALFQEVRKADSLEALEAIDLDRGWP